MTTRHVPWWSRPITVDHEKPVRWWMSKAGRVEVKRVWPGPEDGVPRWESRPQLFGAWAELARRLDAMGFEIFPVRDGMELDATILALRRISHRDAEAAILPIMRLPFGFQHIPTEVVSAFLAEAARQVALRWFVLPAAVRSLQLMIDVDPVYTSTNDLRLFCTMKLDWPEVGSSTVKVGGMITPEIMKTDPEYLPYFLDNWARQMVLDLLNWAEAHGGRPWQGVVESRRDMEAEDRGYKRDAL